MVGFAGLGYKLAVIFLRQTGANEISSKAKSLPDAAVFWLTMPMVAVVLLPELHLTVKFCQMPKLEVNVILPNKVPLIEKLSIPGLADVTDVPQTENT